MQSLKLSNLYLSHIYNNHNKNFKPELEVGGTSGFLRVPNHLEILYVDDCMMRE